MGSPSPIVQVFSDLQHDGLVDDLDRESPYRLIGGQAFRSAGAQVENRAMTRTLDRAFVGVQFTLVQRRVFMRAAVHDREQGTGTVEDDNWFTFVFDHAPLAGLQFRNGTDRDGYFLIVSHNWIRVKTQT